MSYSDLLKDPKWQKKRLEILERDEWTCQECEDKTTTLHVHHTYYEKGKKPWEYPDDALRTLCETCHAQVTRELTEVQRVAGMMSSGERQMLLGYAWTIHLMSGDWSASLTLPTAETIMGAAQAGELSFFTLLSMVQANGGTVTIDALRAAARAEMSLTAINAQVAAL